MKKRLRFTKAELKLIYDMTWIASFAEQSEGDYQEWKKKEYRTLYRLKNKLDEKFENS